MPIKPKSFRFTEPTIEMLARLTAYRGGSQTTILEQLIREAFRAEEKAIERAERKGQTGGKEQQN